MSANIGNSRKAYESCYVRGEAISLWVPLGFALLGIISSIFISQSLLFSDLNKRELLSSPPHFSTLDEQKAERSTSSQVTGSLEGEADDDGVNDSRFFDAELKNSNDSAATNDNTEKIPATSGKNIIGKTSENISGLSEPAPFDDSGKIAALPEVEKKSEDAVETIISPDIDPESLLLQTQDCPPLFFFTFSKGSELPDAHKLMQKIKRLNSWLGQHPDIKVFIEGHADSSGPEEYNLLLSYRRAKAAEKILIDAGTSKNQLITRAFGEQEPLQGQPPQSEKNRRTSIRVEPLEECINALINGDSN